MIERKSYLNKIMAYTDAPFIKILTGIRRCGKSTILKIVMEKLVTERGVLPEQIAFFRFDSMEYEGMTAKEIYALLKERILPGKRTYFFLDEVQEIEGWEKIVNSVFSDFDVDLYITGSNSRRMSSEIETYLTGRYVSFRIYMLSFAEYLDFKRRYTPFPTCIRNCSVTFDWGAFPRPICRTIHRMKFIPSSEIFTIP